MKRIECPSKRFVRGPKEMGSPLSIATGGLFILLALTMAGAYFDWTLNPDVVFPASGYVAMIIGTIFVLVIGVALLGILFHGSYKRYTEPSRLKNSNLEP
jgi:hypothetical protein